MKNVTRVIVLGVEPIDYEAISRVFRGNSDTLWYKAFVQLLENKRIEVMDAAKPSLEVNNALVAAASIGAYEAISQLIDDIATRAG